MAELEINSLEEAKEKMKELDPEGKAPKPTEEEKKAAHAEFLQAVANFNNDVYDIGTPERKDEIADYLLNFIDKRVFWTKQGWMGVLKLHEEITETKNKAIGIPFTLGYQALEFTFFALTNVGGIGLQSAKDMEEEAPLFAEIVDIISKQLEAARNKLKDIQFLQDKWASYEQGFYYEREIEPEPEAQNTFIPMTLEEAEAELDHTDECLAPRKE